MRADSGKVSILGKDVQDDKTRANIGFVLEADGLYDNMTANANLMYYARLYSVDKPAEKIDASLKLVGLSERAGDKVGSYSKGMRQRLALARAMVPDPDLLVLDEPTAGVDPTGQIDIRELMLDLIHKRGKTILLSSHNLDEVQRICNRIALINKGEIRLYGDKDKLQKEMGHGGVQIETAEPVAPALIAEINKLPGFKTTEQDGTRLSLSSAPDADVSSVVTLLASRGARIEQVKKQEASLEEMYTTIVREAEQK
jgi:ABC-2 type transport system ATP-binding protein